MTWTVSADPKKFDAAVAWFDDRFPITQELADALGEYAGDRAWTIAGVAQLDVVQQVHDSIKKAIADGTPFDDWKADISDTLTEAWGKRDSFRVETIFRNATMGAYNAGRWRQMTDPEVAAFRPYALFDDVRDEHESDICQELGGTILPLDDPWWDEHSPPMHHNCRSRVRNLRESEAQRRGITESPPKTEADDGFGKIPTGSSWEPKASDYDPKIWNLYKEKAGRLADEPQRELKRTG